MASSCSNFRTHPDQVYAAFLKVFTIYKADDLGTLRLRIILLFILMAVVDS